jgi:rubrerythrin
MKRLKKNAKRLSKAKQRIHGWLTKDDIAMLEEASKRVLKYPKNPAKKYGCDDCSYTWLYSSVKCPVCASPKTKTMG